MTRSGNAAWPRRTPSKSHSIGETGHLGLYDLWYVASAVEYAYNRRHFLVNPAKCFWSTNGGTAQ
ncbi:hypothetical protein EMIT0P253_90067 [Pseudomonas sp. IT-P253]